MPEFRSKLGCLSKPLQEIDNRKATSKFVHLLLLSIHYEVVMFNITGHWVAIHQTFPYFQMTIILKESSLFLDNFLFKALPHKNYHKIMVCIG
jgi:hypothetical protein